jgi:ubiquinone/menaquinone biosynthesis C-methylase UbiE
MDAEQLELEDASFDSVISFSAIFHFPTPQKAVDEMFRVTKSGGKLVLSYTAMRPLEKRALFKFLLGRVRMHLMSTCMLF